MKNTLLVLLFSVSCALQNLAQPNMVLQNFANGFTRPVDITHCGDGRLFIVEQDGVIWILDENGSRLPNAFLNINPRVGSSGNEQGLLGLAFHPNYASNGFFFVNYTDNNGDTKVSRFSVSTGDPNVADPASEKILLSADQPFGNHNGGCVKFGPDGYLYIGLGDGGSGGDPQNNGQKRTTFLGKMLRIDVDNGDPYSIPSSNPFVNDPNTLDEIWALGLRNPWRFSFDRQTGDLWIGDVGQDAWEEVDFQPVTSAGGENYGWRCYEGDHTFNTSGCAAINTMTFPVAEYQNSGSIGCSITGGFVYRGCQFPHLFGRYLYTDYCTGRIWSIVPDGAGGWLNEQVADLNNNQFVSFGENVDGELFLAGLGNGIIYQVTETTNNLYESTPACLGSNSGNIQPLFSVTATGMTAVWSDGSTDIERTGLAPGDYAVTLTNSAGCEYTETVTIEAAPSPDVIVTTSAPICRFGELQFNEIGGDAIEWSWSGPNNFLSSEQSPTLTNLDLSASGNYTVIVTSQNGCTSSVTASVTVLPSPEPTISVNGTVFFTNPGFETYQWFLDNEPIAGATMDSLPVVLGGAYYVVVMDAAGCTGQSETELYSIENVRYPEGIATIKATPNPFGQNIQVEILSNQPVTANLSVTDLQGKTLLMEVVSEATEFRKSYPLEYLPKGVYLLKVKIGDSEWSERIVRQ